MPTSLPKASDLGILANGTDQTAALNAVFLNSAYAGVVIDYSSPSAVTISGTLNCQGKQLIFAPLSYLTGSGTIANCVINAGYRQKCFDITNTTTFIKLSDCKMATEYFSAMWYGADPTGVSSSALAIQKSLDMAVSNPAINTVFLPSGTYTIDTPILIYNWTGSVYGQSSVNLVGEGKFWQGGGGSGTIIICSFRNTFALGIQGGKGNIIRGIYFHGLFTPPTLSKYQFYTCAFSAFTDGSSRDEPFSPYSGIVIDPFGPSVPTDGGYPGYTSFYRGGSGGSTGVNVEDCIVSNFVVGMITSPSAGTANAELMNWNKIQFANCKACIVGCQTQEKMNSVFMVACWSNTHTFFDNGSYGNGAPGHWVIKGVNIAGQMNTFITRNGTGYFPMHISDVFAESLGVIGNWSGDQGDCLQDSTFNFVTPDVFTSYPAASYFTASGITIKNCEFRLYGWYLPLTFNGGTFENCSFDRLPYGTGEMRNCSCFNGAINPSADIQGVYRTSAARQLAGGRCKFVDRGDYQYGKLISLNYEDYNSGSLLYLDGINRTPSTFTLSGTVATVTPPGTGDLQRAIIGRLALDTGTGKLLGIITAVGASTYTISYVPNNIISGSYVIAIWCPIQSFSFMGTCTAGSNSITNVILDFGNFTDLLNYGGGFVKIPGFYGYRYYSQEAVIVAYNPATATFTMDRPATFSATNYYFSSNLAIKDIKVVSRNDSNYGSGNGISNTEIMPKGSIWTTDIPNQGRQKYMITETGYYNSIPQATWTELT